MNVWLPVQDEAGVLAALLARGWVVAPGSPYRLDGAGQGIRITTATLTDSEAARLAGDVAAALDPAPSGRSG